MAQWHAGIVWFLAGILLALPTTSDALREQQYFAKQVSNLRVDGDLNEWQQAEVLPFDQLKDVGAELPKPNDFTGSARVGWNVNDPTRIYFAVEITDDELQDIHPANNTWWEDDSVEFMFDFDNDMVQASLVQWTLGANGKDLSAAGSADNTEWVVVNQGDRYIYEVALDPTKPRGASPGNATKGNDFKAEAGLLVGMSVHANECENGTREQQIGWTAGGAWDPLSYGDLVFDSEVLSVAGSGKLAVVWGRLKWQ